MRLVSRIESVEKVCLVMYGHIGTVNPLLVPRQVR